MQVAIGRLGWSPEVFWNSTPWDLAPAVKAQVPRSRSEELARLREISANAPDRVRSIA